MNFFIRNAITIFFFYGLALFSMGLAIFLEVRKGSRLIIISVLPLLALFGIIHGANEWLDMGLLIRRGEVGASYLTFIMIVLGLSLLALMFFGSVLIAKLTGSKWATYIPFFFIIIWFVFIPIFFHESFPIFIKNGIIWLHYFWYLPGAILTAVGLFIQHKSLREKYFTSYANDFLIVGILFILMGLVRIFSVSKSFYFPPSVFNNISFLNVFGVSGEFVRAIIAVLIAIFTIRGLRIFEEETKRQVQTLEEKRRILGVIESTILKKEVPKTNELDFATHYESATKAIAVGGDFYDFINVNGQKLLFVIGDVSGKGVEATADALLVSQSIHSIAFELEEPKDIIERLNKIIYRKKRSEGFYVTLVLFSYDCKSNVLTYANSGHPYPIYCTPEICTFIKKSGLALGIRENETYEQGQMLINKGDILGLYTDGLVEARNNGEFFTDERLKNLISHNRVLSAQELVDLSFKQVKDFSEGVLEDDLAMMYVKRIK